MLRPFLDTLPHVLKDSYEASTKLRSLKLPRNIRFYKADVDEFSLSGEHPLLVSLCAEVVEEAYRDMFAKVCAYVLHNQFVTVQNHDGEFWQVTRGSGMGLTCSPEVANTSFARLVEKHISRPLRARSSVVWYGRFMDDIRVLGAGPRGSQAVFLAELRARAGQTFKIVVESVSEERMALLDLMLIKGREFQRSGRLDIEVYRKATSLARPLGYTSFHPQGVHKSWPLSLLKRSRKLFTCKSTAKVDVDLLLKGWASYGTHCYDAPPVPRPLTPVVGRLVVPFHSSLANARFSRILKRHERLIAMKLGLGDGRLQVSWRLGYPRLSTRLQRFSYLEHENFALFDCFLSEV